MVILFAIVSGVIIGMLIIALILLMFIILKDPIERKVKMIYEIIPKVKVKGAIVEPESDIAAGQRHIIEENKKPDGYNVGFNCGKAAGQTVAHFHCHIIPRYDGDVKNPSGGIRHCIPNKGHY